MKSACLFLLLACAGLHGQTPTPAQVFDRQLTGFEREFVPLVQAMPADKMNFAPSASLGEFKGVRTFAQQATHIATVIYEVSAAALGEKNPVEVGEHENGPATLTSKEAIVKYVQDSFVYAHKAMNSLTAANLMDQITSPFGDGKMSRVAAATIAVWHSYDHYGQMVIYARLNGVVPPASRAQ